MLFNILGVNSADVSYSNIGPVANNIREIFSLCGYDSVLTHNVIEDNAINIFFEHFHDKELLNNLIQYKKTRKSTVKNADQAICG
jgi:hypothetical protein